MERKYFSFGDVLGFGWAVMKANFWFFVGLLSVCIIINWLPALINLGIKFMPISNLSRIISEVLSQIVGHVVGIVLAIGLIKVALSYCDERMPSFGTLFAAKGCFWRYIGMQILLALIVGFGVLLLIIPGIIWSIKFSLAPYFVVDKGLGPIEALRASSRTTNGVKWELLGFGIVCGAINLLGLICLVVGMFAAAPTVFVASALLYRQLLAQTPELAEFGIGNAEPRTDVMEI